MLVPEQPQSVDNQRRVPEPAQRLPGHQPVDALVGAEPLHDRGRSDTHHFGCARRAFGPQAHAPRWHRGFRARVGALCGGTQRERAARRPDRAGDIVGARHAGVGGLDRARVPGFAPSDRSRVMGGHRIGGGIDRANRRRRARRLGGLAVGLPHQPSRRDPRPHPRRDLRARVEGSPAASPARPARCPTDRAVGIARRRGTRAEPQLGLERHTRAVVHHDRYLVGGRVGHPLDAPHVSHPRYRTVCPPKFRVGERGHVHLRHRLLRGVLRLRPLPHGHLALQHTLGRLPDDPTRHLWRGARPHLGPGGTAPRPRSAAPPRWSARRGGWSLADRRGRLDA
ncbi:unannotated protein [freshwater metagenome]|uniref:Unannotated protein n=1 Tax=freshwater metagenome TaxID=449393 RepID=A0A6J6U681_9ZZZZ